MEKLTTMNIKSLNDLKEAIKKMPEIPHTVQVNIGKGAILTIFPKESDLNELEQLEQTIGKVLSGLNNYEVVMMYDRGL